MKRGFFIFASVAFLAVSTLEARELPRLTGRVVDEAGLLTAEQEATLTQKLADYEKQTTNQIVVVTIPSLDGEVLEDFSIRLAEKWKIGQKGKDNGVILLIARDDRNIRIEVGYGLEAVLTDSICGDIIRNTIAPRFKKERFYEGIDYGITEIIQVIEGPSETANNRIDDSEQVNMQNRNVHKDEDFNYLFARLAGITFVISFFGGLIGFAGKRILILSAFGTALFATMVSLGMTYLAYHLEFFNVVLSIEALSVALMIFFFYVVICWALPFFLLQGIFVRGSWSSGSGGGSFFGGFSGGGGSFGGGGASGGW